MEIFNLNKISAHHPTRYRVFKDFLQQKLGVSRDTFFKYIDSPESMSEKYGIDIELLNSLKNGWDKLFKYLDAIFISTGKIDLKDEALIDNIVQSWERIEKPKVSRPSQYKSTFKDIYDKYVAPAFLEIDPPIALSWAGFSQKKVYYKELDELFKQFVAELFSSGDEGTPNEDLIDKIVLIIRDLYAKQTFVNRLHEDQEKPKSYHEFAIRDIFVIIGVPFQIEQPVLIDVSKVPDKYKHLSWNYVENAIVDFVLPGNEIFELFGDMRRTSYKSRKLTKIYSWDNFWYIDFDETPVRGDLLSRVLSSYASLLDSGCCFTGSGERESALRCNLSLQGRKYVAELEKRIPLLSNSKFELNSRYLEVLNQAAQTGDLDKIRERAKILSLIPYPIGEDKLKGWQKEAQYKIDDYLKKDLPTLQEITSNLKSKYISVDRWSDAEKVAVFFETPENILRYINMFKNKEEGLQVAAQSVFSINKEASLDFDKKVKEYILSNDFFKKLFDIYDVPIEKINSELKFYIIPLDGKNAKSNGSKIFLNESLFKDGNFFPEGLHFVVHELVHWLTRQREKDCYFADPEEMEAFTMGMCWEIMRGKKKEDIFKVYLPIIKMHFKDIKEAELLCYKFYNHAEKLCSKLR